MEIYGTAQKCSCVLSENGLHMGVSAHRCVMRVGLFCVRDCGIMCVCPRVLYLCATTTTTTTTADDSQRSLALRITHLHASSQYDHHHRSPPSCILILLIVVCVARKQSHSCTYAWRDCRLQGLTAQTLSHAVAFNGRAFCCYYRQFVTWILYHELCNSENETDEKRSPLTSPPPQASSSSTILFRALYSLRR